MAQSLRAQGPELGSHASLQKQKKIKIRFPPRTPHSLLPLCLNLPSVTFHGAGPWMTTSLGWPSFWKCALFNLPLCHWTVLKKKYSYLVCFLTPPGRRVRANGFGVCWWAPSSASSQLDAQETFVLWHLGPGPAWGWGQGTVCLPGAALLRISDERVKQKEKP